MRGRIERLPGLMEEGRFAELATALYWAFRDLDLERVEMTTTPENEAARRVG